MIIETLTLGPFDTHCYIVAEGDSSDAMVIDPAAEEEKIFQVIEKHRWNVTYIVNTHGHSDHIGANGPLKRRFPNAPLCISEKDSPKLTDPVQNLSMAFGPGIVSPPADMVLKEGDVLTLGSLRFKVLEIPGHTTGGIALHLENGAGGILFAGDTIFEGSIGNTDFPGGNYPRLVSNIRQKVLTLSGATSILPGHGPRTTVEREKKSNPFLKENREEK